MNWFRRILATGAGEAPNPAVQKMLDEQFRTIHVRTDRMFAVLMALQWIGGIVMALVVSPRTWLGAESSLHPHVLMAVMGGGVFATLPILLAIVRPGRASTRFAIAASQVLFSALLIHLSGGRIETHFHVFGSLAFLAAYRDPRVLVPATLIVAVDHFLRGVWWPESVFGVATASNWRWLEHAAWVLFEDLFLVIIIQQSRREMCELAMHTDELQRREADLERAIDAAERANRTKSKFLANMSHEIRTPLNGILGFAEVMLRDRGRLSAEESHEYLTTIHRSGQHLLSLINDVLDLSKIEADQFHVESIPCSPHEALSHTVSIMRVSAAEKGITLDYRWEGPIPGTIHTDPYRLKQLLLNLVGNAIKFTHQGSVIVVARIDRGGERPQLVVEVRDTGIGIPADKLEAVFQPFVQADDTVTRKYGGTGLGLSISRRIATALGGTLTAQSIVGQGSTFIARIAAGEISAAEVMEATSQHSSADVKESRTATRDLNGLRALVVDDGDTNRKLIRLLLERGGARVQLAENGQIAVDMAKRMKFDAILMDMQMPVMDGYTATAKLRQQGYAGPVIALTAHAMKGDREKCKQAGCTGFLPKPIDADQLFEALTGLTPVVTPQTVSNPAAADDQARGPIRSLLPTDDAEIRTIVSEFFEALDRKLAAMESACRDERLDELALLAHWLMGAGGTVGFDCFTSPANQLEEFAQKRDLQAAQSTLNRIRNLEGRLVL